MSEVDHVNVSTALRHNMHTTRCWLIGLLACVCIPLGCSDDGGNPSESSMQNGSPDTGPTDVPTADDDADDRARADGRTGSSDNDDASTDDTSEYEGDGSGGNPEDASSGGDDAGDGPPPSCLRNKFQADAPESCQASSEDRPQRCDADLLNFSDWGPVSVVSELKLLSEQAKTETFDLNNKSGVDNNMASLLGIFSALQINVDERIQQNIDQGELTFALEHQGVSSVPPSSNPYAINPMMVSFQDSNQTDVGVEGTPYLAEPESFKEGAFPRARLDTATMQNGTITTEPGNLTLQLELGVFEVSIPVRGATLRADVTSSSVSDGLALENGRIGGYVLIRDVYDILNEMYQDCSCLDNPETTFQTPEVPAGEPDLCENKPLGECSVTCRQAIKNRSDMCTPDRDGAFCSGIDLVCNIIGSTVTKQADLDTDCDGNKDAISLGATFEATGGNMEGTSESVSASNQTVSDPQAGPVTVDSALVEDDRWIVLRGTGQGDKVFGYTSTTLDSGTHSDIDIPLIEGIQDGWGLKATIHKDTGEKGMFEFNPNNSNSPDQPVTDAQGDPISARFIVNTQ